MRIFCLFVVYLQLVAGHSRGGKGSLLLGSHYPDLFLGIVSISGYSDREMYGDANIQFDLDTQMPFLDAKLLAIQLATVAENDAAFSVNNLAATNISVFLRSGGSDTTVNPYFQRHLLRLLHNAQVPTTFEEKPGVSHWTWDWTKPEDGGMVFDPIVRRFINQRFQQPRSKLVLPLVVTVLNPSTFGSVGGILIRGLRSRLEKGMISISRACLAVDCPLVFIPRNVVRFTVLPTFFSRL